MQTWYFYLARCSAGSLYAGVCLDLKQREATHNSGTGARYTRGRLPVHIVYSERYGSKTSAMKREFEVEQGEEGAAHPGKHFWLEQIVKMTCTV